MTPNPVNALAALMSAVLFPTLAMAGSIMKMESREMGAGVGTPDTILITTEGSDMRVDAVGQSADDAGSMVFKSNVNEMTAIDHSRKEYFVLDEAALQGIAGQVSDAMQQMQAALADLPPEQRAMAEQMMKQRMGGMGETIKPRTLSKTGESATVNGFDCEIYDVIESGQKTRDMCVTSWSNIEDGAGLSRNMVRMAGFFENMREMFSQTGMDLMGSRSDVFSHMREINGFPVRSRNYDNAGNVVEETTLISSESQAVDAEIFQPPEAYTQQTLQR
jgi:hypothetical protein